MPEVKRRGATFQSAQVLGVCKRLMSDKLASEARKSTTCCRRLAVLHLWNCTVQQMIHCRNLWPVAYPHGRCTTAAAVCHGAECACHQVISDSAAASAATTASVLMPHIQESGFACFYLIRFHLGLCEVTGLPL